MQTNLEGKLDTNNLPKRTVWSQVKSGTAKGLKIAYGIAVVAGIAYVIGHTIYEDVKADLSPACEEVNCSPTFYESCYKRVTDEKNADHCIINNKGEKECCKCNCYWDNM